VLPQRGRDAFRADGVEVLRAAVRPPLHEVLLVQVVREAGDEDVEVAHDHQDVEPLVELETAHRQVVFCQREAELLQGFWVGWLVGWFMFGDFVILFFFFVVWESRNESGWRGGAIRRASQIELWTSQLT